MIWRRLKDPNVLPLMGVSPEPSKLRIVSEWMINGNIADFTMKDPEHNRLRLVRSTFVSPSNFKY